MASHGGQFALIFRTLLKNEKTAAIFGEIWRKRGKIQKNGEIIFGLLPLRKLRFARKIFLALLQNTHFEDPVHSNL